MNQTSSPRRPRLLKGWSLLACMGLAALANQALACSGPPPPRVIILPKAIRYSYFDAAGVRQFYPPTGSPPIQLLNDFGQKTGTGTGDYQFCDGGASVPITDCYDDFSASGGAGGIARLEVPAGAEITFQAFWDKPPKSVAKGASRDGPVYPHIGSVREMITNARSSTPKPYIKISEMLSRGSGAAFDVTAANPIRAHFPIDWANLDADAPDFTPPSPRVMALEVDSLTSGGNNELAQPPYFPDGTWRPQDERWYVRAGTYAGNEAAIRNAVRILHKNVAGLSMESPEVWMKVETRTTSLGNEPMRLHLWVASTDIQTPSAVGQMDPSVSNAILQIDATDPDSVSSQWHFDRSPRAEGNRAVDSSGLFVHHPVNGIDSSGVGFSSATDDMTKESSNVPDPVSGPVTFESAFTKTHRFMTPTEPGGYFVRADVELGWKYGKWAGAAEGITPASWLWRFGIDYLGYVDLRPISSVAAAEGFTACTGCPSTTDDADVNKKGRARFVKAVDELREQLRCLASDGPVNSTGHQPFVCNYPTSPIVSEADFNAALMAAYTGSGTSGLGKAILQELGLHKSQIDHLDAEGVLALRHGSDGSGTPPATQMMTFGMSGKFPQTTSDNPGGGAGAGKPGRAYIMVKDTAPPRHYAFFDLSTDASFTGDAYTAPDFTNLIIEEAETGKLLAQSLADAGNGTKLGVMVFDDNPSSITFGLMHGAEVVDEAGSDLTGALGPYSSLVSSSALDGTEAPYIEAWYTAQKSGYSFKPGFFASKVGRFSMDRGMELEWLDVRNSALGSDSYLIPDPTFRFYPFRENPDDVQAKRYYPYRYKLIQRRQPAGTGAEPLAAVWFFAIDMNDAHEPMGTSYAVGAEEGDDPAKYPGFDEKMMKLFIRTVDGRLGRTPGTGAGFIPYDATATFVDPSTGEPFVIGNHAPYWDAAPEHEESVHFATRLFPDNKVPINISTDTAALVPEATYTEVMDAARAEGFDSPSGDLEFGRAASLRVKDVIPPSVVVMITDTKYGRTMSFGNPFLGEMSRTDLQLLLREGARRFDSRSPVDLATNDTPENVTEEVLVPSDTDAPTDFSLAASYDPTAPDPASMPLYPPVRTGLGLQHCAAPGDEDCLVQPNASGEYCFIYDEMGNGETDYNTQLQLIEGGAFHPVNSHANSASFPGGDCDPASGNDPDNPCRLGSKPGLWVDEDTQLEFRILIRDNLNSYLAYSPDDGGVDGFEKIFIQGVDPTTTGIGNGPGEINVTIHDPASGNVDPAAPGASGATNNLVDRSSELAQTWPRYTFRNPNRVDNGSSGIDSRDDAYVLVEYTDASGNKTCVKVNMFVVENTMRILSLRESRERSMD